MIQLSQIKLPISHKEDALKKAIASNLKLKGEFSYKIIKKSLDARKKDDLKYIYSVQLSLPEEEKVLKRAKNKNAVIAEEICYQFPKSGVEKMKERPVIVGAGPAGLFCALMLAKAGYQPLLLERGKCVTERVKSIEHYWETKELDPECNVQFGEGGAGTFSDGKLNTGVKDKWGRNKKVLETFVSYGAPEEILYWNKPHIGTDLLRDIIINMREDIIKNGGEVRFSSKVTDIRFKSYGDVEQQKEGKIGEIEAICVNGEQWIPCSTLVIAVGHSARDTFQMLYDHQLYMTKKSFAICNKISGGTNSSTVPIW